MDRVNYTRDFVKQPVLIVNDDTQANLPHWLFSIYMLL
jgi:hypothetical protein